MICRLDSYNLFISIAEKRRIYKITFLTIPLVKYEFAPFGESGSVLQSD